MQKETWMPQPDGRVPLREASGKVQRINRALDQVRREVVLDADWARETKEAVERDVLAGREARRQSLAEPILDDEELKRRRVPTLKRPSALRASLPRPPSRGVGRCPP
jgi:hypothetical protein